MASASGKIVWAGRVISGLVSLLFAMSAFMKFRGGTEVTQGMAHLGLPESLIMPLARAHRLSVYDSLYLELAERRGLALATLDAELATAAKAIGVEILP